MAGYYTLLHCLTTVIVEDIAVCWPYIARYLFVLLFITSMQLQTHCYSTFIPHC